MPRHNMSDKEKAYFFCLLFPIFWPLGIAMAMCDLGEAIKRGLKALWRRILSRVKGRSTPDV